MAEDNQQPQEAQTPQQPLEANPTTQSAAPLAVEARAQGRPMQVCKFFLQNRCAFGDRCRNVHPAVAPYAVGNGMAPAYPFYPQSTVCRFYLRGACKFGDSCRFEHPADQAPTAQETAPATDAPKESSDAAQGEAPKAEAPKAEEEAPKEAAPAEEKKEESSVVEEAK